jgi:hypothetical protein
MAEEQPNDRPQYLEELRFAKKQQWAVTTAAITLLAAIYAVAKDLKPELGPKEKVAIAVLVTLIACAGVVYLTSLQSHLRETRLKLDPEDKEPWLRGVSVLAGLVGTVILGAAFVIYVLTLR